MGIRPGARDRAESRAEARRLPGRGRSLGERAGRSDPRRRVRTGTGCAGFVPSQGPVVTMGSRPTTWCIALAALLGGGRALALQGQGLKPSDSGRPSLPDVDPGKPPTARPDTGNRSPAPIRAEAEERLVPDAAQTSWRMWLARNFHFFEAAPLDPAAVHPNLPPHLLDADVRAEKRAVYEREVEARLSCLLSDADDRVRGAAAISLARANLVDDVGDADALFRLLADDQRRVRDQALLAAALADGSSARYHVLRFASAAEEPASAPTESERARVRALAAVFASLRGEPLLAHLVADLVGDRRLATSLRALVIQSLGLAGNLDASAALVAIARDRGEAALVRAAAVTALGELGDRSAAPVVVALLEDRDHDAEVRASAALAVGSLVDVADTDAVRALVRVHEREGNATVARFLLLSLGRVGGPHAELEIQRVLTRESAEERVFAELALGLVARASATPQKLTPLLEALRTVRIQDERCALLCALGLSALPQALEPIAEQTLGGGAPEVRRSGIVALELLGQAGGLPILQKLLLDDDVPEVRIQSARALGRLDPGCSSTLVHALGSSGRSRGTGERAALILALGFTRDPSVIASLLDLLRERGPSSQEREAATLALGVIYDAHRAPPTARIGVAKSFLRESTEIPGLLALAE